MPRQTGLSVFSPFVEIAGVFVATKGGLRCTAIKLQDGGICLYSPIAGLNAEARNSLDVVGKVTHLFAPNHYHNRGLAEYSSAYPDALLRVVEGRAEAGKRDGARLARLVRSRDEASGAIISVGT
jgi:hypothetical protein